MGPESDLYQAQPITFACMRRAKEEVDDSFKVDLVSVQYAEDHPVVPDDFLKTPDLERSILDLGVFDRPRKLPLVADLFRSGFKASPDADVYVYTNVDIAPQPHFYTWIAAQVSKGLDAFVINRRTIHPKIVDPTNLEPLFAEKGEPHPGYDCFVMHRDVMTRLELGNVAIGAAFIGLAMYMSLRVHSRNFKEFDSEYLTFHIGNDQVWKDASNNPYAEFNRMAYRKVIQGLQKHASRAELQQYRNEAFGGTFNLDEPKQPTRGSRSLWQKLIGK